jgi:uncharacterized protein (TIGR03437 family)
MRILKVGLFLCMVSVSPLAAQTPTFDTSGNGLLKGTYYFRQVLYGIDTNQDSNGLIGDISESVAVYGNITFDGNGNYSITNALVADSAATGTDPLSCYLAGTTCNANQAAAVPGTYAISASGFGSLSNAITGDNIIGLVAANGIFSGSSTEAPSAYNDFLIAAPAPTTQPAFSGAYNVAGYFGSPGFGEDMFFQINPNGAGSLGTVNVSGYYEGGKTSTVSQSSNVTYTFSNNAAVLTFPTSSTANFFSGQEYIYFSPDGKFFFGGSPNYADMIVGVNNTSSAQTFQGLFYQSGIDQNFSDIGGGFVDFDGYYGSFNATSAGSIVSHERISDQIFTGSTYGLTFADAVPNPVTSTYTDTGQEFQYAVGDGGAVRIGQGIGPYVGLSVAFQAPTFTPPSGSVYINPTGIVNAASFAPFTAGIANGEFAAIFGTNLAPSTLVASSVPYPTKLNGVQVLVDGIPAPIYFVSSGQIAFIMPGAYPSNFAFAPIQVVNNGTSSNIVTELVNPTVPGLYTNPSGGIYAAAVDTNTSQIVTPSTPARPGDTIEVFATGLGTAFPSVPDGAAPPISPLSNTVNTIQADVDGTAATVLFAGLAPTLAGLYQINVTLPTTITSGNHALDISGIDPTTTALQSYAEQVIIPVGTGGADRPAEPSARSHTRRNSQHVARQRLCLPSSKTACRF